MLKFGKKVFRIFKNRPVTRFTATTKLSKEEASKNKEINLNNPDKYENYTSSNYDDNITEYNFIQGYEPGNCGMIASMATLASNLELYNKVVPSGQNFRFNSQSSNSNSSEFVFNLYKLGKLHKVVVDGILPTDRNGLIYSESYNENLVGPFLEKALIKLHFDGKYDSAEGITGYNVLRSFSNNVCERYVSYLNKCKNYSRLNVDDLINHGLKTKSQMVVTFKEDVLKYSLRIFHFYTLVDIKNNGVKLYDPHGNRFSIPKKIFYDNLFFFEISYFNNKVFGMSEIKTYLEFTETWPALKNHQKVHIMKYNLIVEQDDTEVLINLIVKHSSDIITCCCIFSESDLNDKHTKLFLNPDSFRANLNSGKYYVLIKLWDVYENENSELYSNYLENGGNEFIFRLAASKLFSVKKSVLKETEKFSFHLV